MGRKTHLGLFVVGICFLFVSSAFVSCSKQEVCKLWEVEYPCDISKNNGLEMDKHDPKPYARNHLYITSSKNILQVSFENYVLDEPKKYNSMRMSVDVNTGKVLKLPEFETDPCHISRENSFHGITDGEFMYSYEFFNIICWRLDNGEVIWKKQVASEKYYDQNGYELALVRDTLVYVQVDNSSTEPLIDSAITGLDKKTGKVLYNKIISNYEISDVLYNNKYIYLIPGGYNTTNKICYIKAENGDIGNIELAHKIPRYYSCIPNGDYMYVIGDETYSVIDLETNKVILESDIEFINRGGQIIDNYMMFYGTEQDYPKSYFNVLVYRINADHYLKFYKKIDLTDKDVYWPDWTTNSLDERLAQRREPYTKKDVKYLGYDVINDKIIWEVSVSSLGENPALIYEDNSVRIRIFASDTKLVCYSY